MKTLAKIGNKDLTPSEMMFILANSQSYTPKSEYISFLKKLFEMTEEEAEKEFQKWHKI